MMSNEYHIQYWEIFYDYFIGGWNDKNPCKRLKAGDDRCQNDL